MNFKVLLQEKEVAAKLINKRNVRHCYLRIIDKDSIQITANRYFSLDDAKDLIYRKEEWILKHLNKKSATILEDEFYYLGEKFEKKDFEKFDLINFYRSKAHLIITPIVENQANIMQLFPKNIKYRNNKSRWGSCSYDNTINLNLNLLKFPANVIEYVVIHELAHIKHKNHSKKFWDLVEMYCPKYKECEKLLKSF
ncbi:M48 family metallopeptidase [Arcobacter sp.]|uniref:M48 family metallopeptidase n=1 Tax=Arcobacter sp. TaxID=1872629 RepID=UPI003D1217E7